MLFLAFGPPYTILLRSSFPLALLLSIMTNNTNKIKHNTNNHILSIDLVWLASDWIELTSLIYDRKSKMNYGFRI